MGMLIDGRWTTEAPLAPSDDAGNFIRSESNFRNNISHNHNDYQPEAGRYHLYLSYACPWASRTLIIRQLKGLTNCISVSFVEPLMLDNGWEFSSNTPDPLYQKHYLYQIYQLADPDYTGKVTVPVLWDKQTQTIVNNESADIIRLLNDAFADYANNDYDFYPHQYREAIDAINESIYENINNGVYRCGFASSQAAYEKAFDQLFTELDKLEQRLAKQRYLIGDQITEADWRLFVTLIRFDMVYYSHFKCNRQRITDYHNLFNYLLDLYQIPGVAETVNFSHIKQHYFGSHRDINPSGIIPKGPEIDFWQAHNRSQLSK